ncbi:hypothetical protein GCM10009696_19360 [Kocuria himachalensis]
MTIVTTTNAPKMEMLIQGVPTVSVVVAVMGASAECRWCIGQFSCPWTPRGAPTEGSRRSRMAVAFGSSLRLAKDT